jgi:tetratricopeptide (TPR) repeat protein
MAENGRFRAFISYSHADQAMARRLHHALETYRVPERLVGQASPRGKVPRRLVPIFRDRDDLPASGDLSASVRDALARSDTLIVICSPAAAASRWVNEEIRTFRELNPGGDILAAIVAGEPEARAAGRNAELECFPPALRRAEDADAEPVAADFRNGGDGWRMALLKLVAGLLSLSLDQLIQRDLQRRQRRVTAITGVSVVLTLIMATLTLFAISAQSEAERRKAEAEDLIEFMLSDLRLKLEPVGRLDVLDAVGEKVIDYYDEQSPRQMSADDLGRRARAFHLLGEIDSAKGELDNAYRHFVTAYQATSRILAVEPSSPARIYEHSQSAFWVGYFAWRRSDLETTEARFLEYRDLTGQLVEAEPGNLEWLAEAAYAHNNLCTLYAEQGRLREAEAEIRRALELFLRIAEADPEAEQAWVDAADAYGWLAQVAEPVHGREAAMDALREQLRILDESLDGGAENWRLRRGAMAAEYALARLYIADGAESRPEDIQSALDILGAASHEADALVEHDPSNVEWRMLAARQRIWLAEASLLAGDLPAAREAYLDASSFMTHPSWSTMDDVRYEDTRHHAALIEARIFLAMGDTDSAQLALDHMLVSLNRQQDWSGYLNKGPYLYAAATNTMADILMTEGRFGEAVRVRTRMVERLEPLTGRMPADTAAEYRRAENVLDAERMSAE